MQYATQLYTLRSLSPSNRCRPVADAGFEGVELVGLDTTSLGLRDCSLDVAAVHVDVDTLEADPDEVVEQAQALGTDTVVVPIVEAHAFHPTRVAETAARFDTLAAEVEDAGGRLLYHNHEFEFEDSANDGDIAESTGETKGREHHERDDETPFEWFVEATTHLGFELDVGWATAAGADPVALIERFGERIPLVHLKDVRLDSDAPRGGVPVDLGDGNVDLEGVLTAAADADVEWVVFEHDDPTEPARTVRDAAVWLDIEPSGPR